MYQKLTKIRNRVKGILAYLEKISLSVIIGLSFFHSLTPLLDTILNFLILIIASITIYRQICLNNIHKNLSGNIFLLILVFLQYVVINGMINCCSLINLKRILRLIIAFNLVYIFSFQGIKDWILRLFTSIMTAMGIILFVLAVTAFINEDLWSQTWNYLLKDFGLYYQLAEKSRGRLSQVSPLEMSILFPLALFFTSKNRFWQLFGATSFAMTLSMIIFWNYRSHIITSTVGILIFFFFLQYSRKKSLQTFSLLSRFLATLLTILIIILSLISAELLLKTNLLDRLLLKDDFDLRTTYEHIDLFKEGVLLFSHNPVVGIGAGNFTQYSQPTKLVLLNPAGKFIGEFPTTNYIIPESHNIVVESLMELGLIGTVLLFIIAWKLIISDIQVMKDSPSPYLIAIIVSSWLFLINSLTDSYSKSALYTLMILRGILVNANNK